MCAHQTYQVREFRAHEARSLLELMQGLAVYEGYADEFRVKERDLVEFGLGVDQRFTAFVVPDLNQDGTVLGMAVIYHIPWTYDLRPVVVLKELFVSSPVRSKGIGRLLLDQVIAYAKRIGASCIHWTVLKDNISAKRFYERAGARQDPIWDRWVLDLGMMQE